jgi:hypothetical protein
MPISKFTEWGRAALGISLSALLVNTQPGVQPR